jgi:hypothetical protein
MTNEFYVFVNLNNPIVRHNLSLPGKLLVSPVCAALGDDGFLEQYQNGTVDFLPFVRNTKVSTGFMSFFTHNIITTYRVEHDAEVCRRQFFPNKPSRLSAIYAFGSFEDCLKASELYGWAVEHIRKFTKKQIVRHACVNMEIVSLVRSAYRYSFSQEEIEKIWKSYWGGDGSITIESPTMGPLPNTYEKHSSGVIWEHLIDGALTLEGDLDTPILSRR